MSKQYSIPESTILTLKTHFEQATQKHEPGHSAHECLSFIREEYKELEAEVFKQENQREDWKLMREAYHIAVTALRFVIDLYGGGSGGN